MQNSRDQFAPNCEIELEPRDDGTLLRLVHSGLPDAMPPLFSPEWHGERWAHFLDRLRTATFERNDRAEKP